MSQTGHIPGIDRTSMDAVFQDYHVPNKFRDSSGEEINKTENPMGFWYWVWTHFAKPGDWGLATMLGSGPELIAGLLAKVNMVGGDIRRSQVTHLPIL